MGRYKLNFGRQFEAMADDSATEEALHGRISAFWYNVAVVGAFFASMCFVGFIESPRTDDLEPDSVWAQGYAVLFYTALVASLFSTLAAAMLQGAAAVAKPGRLVDMIRRRTALLVLPSNAAFVGLELFLAALVFMVRSVYVKLFLFSFNSVKSQSLILALAC